MSARMGMDSVVMLIYNAIGVSIKADHVELVVRT